VAARNPLSVDLGGRIALVTGATSGVGFEAACQLAGLGAAVTLLARDAQRGADARARITEATGNPSVELLLADVSSQRQIREAAQEFRARHDRLDILINNAGAVFPRFERTEDGIEQTFAVNHLGYFLLTTLLLDPVEASDDARIVNVSSIAHRRGRLDFDDLDGESGWSTMGAYRRSKAANVLFTYDLARRFEGRGATANAIHPGLVATNFGSGVRWIRWAIRPIRRWMTQPVEAGAAVVQLAADPALVGVSGRYFEKWDEKPSSKYSHDHEVQDSLWAASERLVAPSAWSAHSVG
jgi:NAD(P)-dependent dehydrogenase (short-subunit alcohol dehydrogenase family)